MELSHNNQTQLWKALRVQVSHTFTEESALFDDDHLVSLAGLVPVMTLADQTRLPQLLAEKVSIAQPRIALWISDAEVAEIPIPRSPLRKTGSPRG